MFKNRVLQTGTFSGKFETIFVRKWRVGTETVNAGKLIYLRLHEIGEGRRFFGALPQVRFFSFSAFINP